MTNIAQISTVNSRQNSYCKIGVMLCVPAYSEFGTIFDEKQTRARARDLIMN